MQRNMQPLFAADSGFGSRPRYRPPTPDSVSIFRFGKNQFWNFGAVPTRIRKVDAKEQHTLHRRR